MKLRGIVTSPDQVPLVWTIPERVQLEVSVMGAEGELVPGATVEWSAGRDGYHDGAANQRRYFPVPDDLSTEPATVNPESGRAKLTVVPWQISIEVEAPGYVSSSSKVSLGGAANAEHAVRLVKAGHLVVRLDGWRAWQEVTLALTRLGDEGAGPRDSASRLARPRASPGRCPSRRAATSPDSAPLSPTGPASRT